MSNPSDPHERDQQPGQPKAPFGPRPEQQPSYGTPPPPHGGPQQSYGTPPQQSYGTPQQSYGTPQQQWPAPAAQHGAQQPGGYPQAPPPQQGMSGAGDKGFFGSLFDFGFTSFVTPKLVKVVYILATVVIALTYLGAIVSGFSVSAGLGVVVLIFGGIGAIFYLGFIRLILELAYAVVRMSQDINQRLPSR